MIVAVQPSELADVRSIPHCTQRARLCHGNEERCLPLAAAAVTGCAGAALHLGRWLRAEGPGAHAESKACLRCQHTTQRVSYTLAEVQRVPL